MTCSTPKTILSSLALSSTLLFSQVTNAQYIDLYAFSGFLSDGTSIYQDDSFDIDNIGFSTFTPDFTTSFTATLDADNYGTLNWKVINKTGATIEDAQIVTLLDAAIFDDEFDWDVSDDMADPYSGTTASSWEVAEGLDLANNLPFDLTLFDSIALPSFFSTGLALGFDVGDFYDYGVLDVTLTLSPTGPGLHLYDDANPGFYLDGTVSVPEPQTLALFLSILGGITLFRRKLVKQESQ
ncbi:hypothetical protein A3K86_03250 [Photobacterium jeanii]|uniref:PEP-CTERM protein-sorting domain-containing protein n=1 Tax=Photobacterium jeanii TaxID=858640 RepID=A0A178KKP3_9GAMM|nr:PEP-CTERM sorting domain-containing protein [Photobacterium jeanii]OAN17948.1 hypothetical protein A3K86_03250 [Photobacterium jeanii]PST92382.1 PEP-CTERM sorting domain-containing protein [Photobacterium jeanii]